MKTYIVEDHYVLTTVDPLTGARDERPEGTVFEADPTDPIIQAQVEAGMIVLLDDEAR